MHWRIRLVDSSHARVIEAGAATSDGDGQFTIRRSDSLAIGEALCHAALGGQFISEVRALDASGELVGEPVVTTRESQSLTIEVQGTEGPTEEGWGNLAEFLSTNRLYLTRDLVEQLVRPFPDSPVRGWRPSVRAAALTWVQGALARLEDPTDSTASLLEQHHYLDIEALSQGRADAAVTQYATQRGVAAQMERYGVGELRPHFLKTDRELYRDYLLGVWVASASGMYDIRGTEFDRNKARYIRQFDAQLSRRFLQDFRTGDGTFVPASTLLIPLVVAVLTAVPAQGGFGFAQGSLPAQGAQDDNEYLRTLTNLPPGGGQELRNRFRVRFDREIGDLTSPIELNIEALIGLLEDTFQSPEEPFAAQPSIVIPPRIPPSLVAPWYLGTAPFFLQYEEWLERQAPFFPENVYDIRRLVPAFDGNFREGMATDKSVTFNPSPEYGDYFGRPLEYSRSVAWIESYTLITDKLREGLTHLDQEHYPEAIEAFAQAQRAASEAIRYDRYDDAWVRDEFAHWSSVSSRWNGDQLVSLQSRAALRVVNAAQLHQFEAFYDAPVYRAYRGYITDDSQDERAHAVARARTLYFHHAIYVIVVLVPFFQARALAALGEIAKAIRILSSLTGYTVGVAEMTVESPYQWTHSTSKEPWLFQSENLPYTTKVGFDKGGAYANLDPSLPYDAQNSRRLEARRTIAPFEQRFFKLSQGELMLDWADELHRNDDPSSIRRARELYKGVLFMHGEDPGLAPRFSTRSNGLIDAEVGYQGRRVNPVRASQTARARLALLQIEEGLNAYGFRSDMVPFLRYRPLKSAADGAALAAKSAQTDFLDYTARFEEGQMERWRAKALVTRADAVMKIAEERVGIAQADVANAQEQVNAVLAKIRAKEQEIADADGFFSQVKTFFGGVKDSLTDLMPLAKKIIAGEGGAAGVVTADQMLTIFEKGIAGGGSKASEEAVGLLGAGGGFVVGMGSFVYSGYQTMEAMADAANKRHEDLRSLREVALPTSQAQVRLKERGVRIATFEQQVARSDRDIALQLLRFQQDRFLKAELWQRMAQLANRLMRRYVDLAARFAWFAERALAFEQARKLSSVRLNYLNPRLRGVTGPDRLLADLAELEAQRLQGLRLTAPVKHTVSLAREFPLAFGEFKRTGRCRFRTREATLREAYPGTFGYRVRAVTATAQIAGGSEVRGVLRNGGISQVGQEDPSQKNVLVRFPDALPLSEFRLRDDLFVYGLPGETLLQFEGSGFDTDWELECPLGANPRALGATGDIVVTFDLNARYSTRAAQLFALAQRTRPIARAVMFAASVWDPRGMASLRDPNARAVITFDLARFALPVGEANRRIQNLAVVCLGVTTGSFDANMEGPRATGVVTFKVDAGVAFSNAGPVRGSHAASPLNAFVGLAVEQTFVLRLDRNGPMREEISRFLDVVLWVEYQANA